MSTVTFDGANKLIVISDTGDVVITAKELYSRWKEWILDNPQWEPAFRTFGGDPLGAGQFAGDYYFLNNVAGWRIKPEEKDHTLSINGNLFNENAALPVFLTTNGDFTVNIRQGFSSLTQSIQSGSGLSTEQSIQLSELHKIHGLTTGKPLKVTQTQRSVENDLITQTITQNGNEVTVERT